MKYLNYLIIGMILISMLKIYTTSDYFNLKCIISDIDHKTYCVRDRNKLSLAADKLAVTTQHMTTLVNTCYKKYPDRENIQRLKQGFNPVKIQETLPTSEHTAYSENKGEKIAFCLNESKYDNDELIDNNTLMFVAIHELAHVASIRIGHTDEFWNNFKFLLQEAEKLNIYTPRDYKKEPKQYCGMTITDNHYYDF